MKQLGKGGMLALALAPMAMGAIGTISSPSEAGIQNGAAAYAEEIGGPVPGLSEEADALFVRGRRLFRWQLWSPSRGVEGFNSTECTECHLEPTFGGTNKDKNLLVAMTADEGDPGGFKVYPRIVLVPGQRSVRREPPPDAELRRTPHLFGIGLLEAVSDEDIAKLEDPADKDGDGISGRRIKVDGGMGRFGWKANLSSLDRMVATAFRNELGIRPESFDQPDFTRLGPNQLQAVTHYVRFLGAPKPSPLGDAAKKGRDLFSRIGCATCHTPQLRTGASAPAPLRVKRVEAYTDLLLHDLGPGPAKPETGSRASSREYRTPPLWGLGRVRGPYLHDASAATLEEAIQRHEGEATAARDRYRKLSEGEQKALIALLESL
jgi:hypothetical protein